MRTMTLIAVATLIAAATAGALGADDAPAPLRVNAMTFNIRYDNAGDGADRWANRIQKVAKVIAERGPDFVGVQEAMVHQTRDLLAALDGYAQVGRTREANPLLGEATPIFYRTERWELVDSETFWLSDTPDVPGSASWGNTLPRIATRATLREKATGRTVTVLNTHLDHASQPSREKSAAMIAERAEKIDGPLIITGDLNADEGNPATRTLLDAGWIDTYRVIHPDERAVRTYHAFTGEVDGGKIDYVLVRKGVKVTGADIIRDHEGERYPSDHFPVWANVEFE